MTLAEFARDFQLLGFVMVSVLAFMVVRVSGKHSADVRESARIADRINALVQKLHEVVELDQNRSAHGEYCEASPRESSEADEPHAHRQVR